MATNKKMHPGCLIALIIGLVLLALIIVHLAIAFYFLKSKFEIKEHTFDETPAESVVEVPADVVSAEEASSLSATSVH
ncbi:hypothetical protein ABAC460_19110 [Asticcacaulis sp. AC460]|uniref:hypothetical protein n=1 Tax=Asticcacaulis sp. AC460 TaxID=1282360 RepID=UPI0003C410A6|nr:hypothetical protein [Asticcacaulis sp. AC460]ESQ87437.1 hypothetical protein ABAC460_19110 [Asticcacaulis sp. AC460]